MISPGQIDANAPGTANYQPDYRALIAQVLAQALAPLGDPGPQYQINEVLSDPASDETGGFTSNGTIFGGPALAQAYSADIADAMSDMGVNDTLGGLLSGYSPGPGVPGTGLGMAVTGYNSGFGTAADQAAAMHSGVLDAAALSSQVNDAVDATGYNSNATPSPAPEGVPGDMAGLVSSPASLNTDVGFGDAAPGFDAGPGVSADQGGANDSGGGVSGGDGGK